ncbi:MAG: response regulator [Anaerolineae bacterium]|nr:response regulator [Anaerolineae bacterium]
MNDSGEYRTMSGEVSTILLVEDDPTYARLIRATLRRSSTGRLFDVAHVDRIADALVILKQREFDAVLLDLSLPDGGGLDTFMRLHQSTPEVPIVVLSGLADEHTALNAVQAGAQDYLVKSQTDMRGLAHALSYAIERQRAQAERSRHITRLAILRDVDEELNRRLDLGYVLTMALDTAVRLGVANAGLIGLLEDDEIRHMKTINYSPEQLPGTDLLEQGIVGRCLRERRSQRVMDVTRDPDYVAVLPATRAQIAIPLLSQDRLLGFLNLESSDPSRFTEETFDFLKLLASRIATAVDNAQLYETSRSQLAELQTLYNQVRDLEQIKTDMIRVATHDLRGPINNVLGFVHLLRRLVDQERTPQAREFLDYIEQSTRRMQTITSEILSLERLDATGELHTEPVDITSMAQRAFREQQKEARQKSQRFHLTADDRRLLVQAEPALLYEAMINLISNAIKYTPEDGAVKIRVLGNDTQASFQVIDTGYGIPADQQERLFQPFFRAETAEVKQIDGTGLGLHLVKNIIDRHNGELIFESEYGQGSTFGFRLPLITEPAPAKG